MPTDLRNENWKKDNEKGSSGKKCIVLTQGMTGRKTPTL